MALCTKDGNAAGAIDDKVEVLEKFSEEKVENDDRDKAFDECLGRGLSDASRPAVTLKATPARDEADCQSKEEAFSESDEDIPCPDKLSGVGPVVDVGDAVPDDRDEPASENAEQIADHREGGNHNDAGNHARNDEIADRLGGHDFHGIDLFGNGHRAELCGESAADPSSEHDGCEHRADLTQDGHIDDDAETTFLSDRGKLIKGLDGKDHADECPDEHDHGDRSGSDFVHLRKNQDPPTRHKQAAQRPDQGLTAKSPERADPFQIIDEVMADCLHRATVYPALRDVWRAAADFATRIAKIGPRGFAG